MTSNGEGLKSPYRRFRDFVCQITPLTARALASADPRTGEILTTISGS
jgi:hypothetical protein